MIFGQINQLNSEIIAYYRKSLNKGMDALQQCINPVEPGCVAQVIAMAGFIQNEPPRVGKDVQVNGSITSEDSGFYVIIISAIIFLIAALTGHLV
jgi:hypothetical protein